MNVSSANGPFNPEEIQNQFAHFMRQHFQTEPPGARAGAGATETPEDPTAKFSRDIALFDYKPRDVKAYLDRFVIQQEEAKKVLSVALCDHYHHVRMALEGRAHANYTKQNIVLIGPTGVGKTYLIRCMAELIGVPFVKGDATKFSETGYVGGDVEDLVRELVRRADGDVHRAQFGIIYIDEIDKIAGVNHLNGRDVSGRGVQTNLLKLMEETEVPARAPNDIAGQISVMMELQQGRKGASVINTKHILFIVSGAFDGLEAIARRRLSESVIGFGSQGARTSSEEVLKKVQTRDFIEFGFEPEFIGRLPVRVVCQPLSEEDLFEVLRTSEGSILRQYEQDFGAYGIDLVIETPAMRRIAELAGKEKTGARGLMTVGERIFRDLKFELPSTCIKRITVTPELVESPGASLEALLLESRKHETFEGRQMVYEFGRRFSDLHGLKIRFTEEAADRMVALAKERQCAIPALCAERFKDFQFGLKLVSQNTGQTEWELDLKAVEEPDQVLSSWVVASYRKT